MICERKPGRARVRGISEIGVALTTLKPDHSTACRQIGNRREASRIVTPEKIPCQNLCPRGGKACYNRQAMATKPATDPADPVRFDDILSRLRALVERLESGNLALEDSLRYFEEGMELCRQGATVLDKAEKRVEVLLAGAANHATIAPLDEPQDDQDDQRDQPNRENR
jgi:exodeoxyribonuclease VII small subunit